MKSIKLILLLLVGLTSVAVFCQSHFSIAQYQQFLDANRDLEYAQLVDAFPVQQYYKGFSGTLPIDNYLYLDSIRQKLQLTEDELMLLEQNRFVVTERKMYQFIGDAFFTIFHCDLPVMVTTDAILHALHMSYDDILYDLEDQYLNPEMRQILEQLYSSYPLIREKYAVYPELDSSLGDLDLYVTIAYSLIQGAQESPRFVTPEKVDSVWNAIQTEDFAWIRLFSGAERMIDFSQFTVRGHYDNNVLRDYFKAMMWLGRIDFQLTMPPGSELSSQDISRMNIDAFLMNELIDAANVRQGLTRIDDILQFFVNESDNLTPAEYLAVLQELVLTSAVDLLDDTVYANLIAMLKSLMGAQQKILSNVFLMNPFSSEPDDLPISYKLMGQRFVLDSYIFSNVVFDRIIYQNKKVWRPMPNPLDAMFVLGNSDAIYLLSDELNTYKYSSQLNALRYLTDIFDDAFWDQSLYNIWLQAIRQLNPPDDVSGLPQFMRTAAWHQQKLNTQLASWSQLRHDNLLYAKQSYTGGPICSFPHSWVEPYPDFYKQVGRFARAAQQYFTEHSIAIPDVQSYFTHLDTVMTILETLARKEIEGVAFDSQEIDFLKKMLFDSYMCGPFLGWYPDLFYNHTGAQIVDFITADVHTQPCDMYGAIVGNVLHAGTGYVNLGIFLASSPSYDFQPMAFVGPVMSYYEKITSNFDRLTDERWNNMISRGEISVRPDWVNLYLADWGGNAFPAGEELPSQTYVSVIEDPIHNTGIPDQFVLYPNYPNPFNATTTLQYDLPEAVPVKLSIYDLNGRMLATPVQAVQQPGHYRVSWDATRCGSGIYFIYLQAGDFRAVAKCILLK